MGPPDLLSETSCQLSRSPLRRARSLFGGANCKLDDQYLRAEFIKQLRGKVTVVLKKEDADGVITGINEEQKGTAAKITGRYLGLHDTVNGTISLLDKTETNILWADEAGDRNLFFGIAHRGGERKVADRLVSKLKKAMGYRSGGTLFLS
jgi:hypothetical protein